MNERIRELAVEADEYAEQTVHYYQGQFDGLTWEGKIKQTRDLKFAELIVRECIDKIETYRIPVGNSAAGEMACEWTYSALKEISDEIKQHFRVEE